MADLDKEARAAALEAFDNLWATNAGTSEALDAALQAYEATLRARGQAQREAIQALIDNPSSPTEKLREIVRKYLHHPALSPSPPSPAAASARRISGDGIDDAAEVERFKKTLPESAQVFYDAAIAPNVAAASAGPDLVAAIEKLPRYDGNGGAKLGESAIIPAPNGRYVALDDVRAYPSHAESPPSADAGSVRAEALDRAAKVADAEREKCERLRDRTSHEVQAAWTAAADSCFEIAEGIRALIGEGEGK